VYPQRAQAGPAVWARCERQNPHAAGARPTTEVARDALTYITAPDDQQTFAAKSRRQRAERALV
jgi:hypothetical protein